MEEKPYFITTPIYYVNSTPHIGSAYTTVAADVYNRFIKVFKKRKTAFLVGTDEHGAKIAEAAAKSGQEPQAYVDELAESFRKTWELLGISYQRFIRTTDKDHIATVEGFLQNLFDKGFITKGVYEGLYCVGHEKFMSSEELVDGKCPEHDRVAEPYKEENYFFRLGEFKNQLFDLINEDKIEIWPIERKNEILGKLEVGLEDISISRANVPWGIPVPFDKTHTIYVWIDALINYYTFGKPQGLWPADLHLVGKDILWFHSVIWPAMLLAIGEEPPQKVFAHGFFTISGSKMSKTLGNVIAPKELVDKFGVNGARYLLLSSFPFGSDGDFDWARLIEKYNSDLANGIGNLTSRITTLAAGVSGLSVGNLPGIFNYEKSMGELDFYNAVGAIQELVKKADQYLNTEKPWTLSEEEKKPILQNLLGMLAAVASLVSPFMPQTSEKIFSALGLSRGLEESAGMELKITKSVTLFPRL